MFKYNANGMWVNVRLGDILETALKKVGITQEKVERFLGKPCKCPERRQKLNMLGAWAKRVLTGKTDDAEKHLLNIMNEEQKR